MAERVVRHEGGHPHESHDWPPWGEDHEEWNCGHCGCHIESDEALDLCPDAPTPKQREEREEDKSHDQIVRETRERTDGWTHDELVDEIVSFYRMYLHEKAYREQYQRDLRTHSPSDPTGGEDG